MIKKFNKDNKYGNKSSNTDYSNNRKNTGSFKRLDKKLNHNNPISIEYVLNLFQKNQGVINLSSLNLSIKDQDSFLSKLDNLNKFEIIKINEESSEVSLNINKINVNLDEYCIIHIIKHIASNHYLVNCISLLGDILEEELIIDNLNEKLSHKDIFVELYEEGEKIYATPLFYLDNIPAQNNKATNVDKHIIKGVVIYQGNNLAIVPLNFKSKHNLFLLNAPTDMVENTLVNAKIDTLFNPQDATYIDTISPPNMARSLSMMSVYQYDIPYEFSPDAKQQATDATQCSISGRVDITNLPLVTIDDEDAKDFDDAIYAEELNDGTNAFKIYVAIADVSHYVLPNSPLDVQARQRGNSVYLPGFVIPMLPEELSNGWCSLKPNEDRGCLLAEIIINRNGLIEEYKFSRALMKSKRRLTYTKVQNAINGDIAEDLVEIMDSVITPLYKCYELLDKARTKRGALDISSADTKIILDDKDNVLDIKLREQNTAHKIVEEFMISANVAAAKFLNEKGLSQKGLCMYRVHEQPSLEKVEEYSKILQSFNINLKAPSQINVDFFNKVLKQTENEYFFHSINEATLRSQAQAKYDVINLGHFGLSLKEYAHFTSPIRRYADLMVHRAILSVIANEEFKFNRVELSEVAQHISITERIAFNAENRAKDRILTKWLSSKIDEEFEAVVSTINNSGMFILLPSCGASGLIPMRTISKSYAFVDLDRHTIKDKETNTTYKLGDKIKVILKEADEIRGLMVFNLKSEDKRNKLKTRY
jgi:ribonuclease R